MSQSAAMAPVHDSTAIARAAARYSGGIAWPTIVLTAACVAGLAASSAAGLQGLWPAWGSVAMNAVFLFAIFTPLHEAVHGNVSGHRPGLAWLDRLVGYISGIPLFAPYCLFRTVHLTHHTHVNHPQYDPDRWVEGRMPLVVLRAITLFPYYAWFVATRRRVLEGRPGDGLRGLTEVAVLVAFATLTAVFLSAKFVLLFWVLPVVLAVVALALLFDWLPHRPHNNQDWLRATRIILVPGLKWPTFWQNYHLIHHILPNVPFWRYDAVFAALEGFLIRNGALIEAPFGDVRAQAAGRTREAIAAPSVAAPSITAPSIAAPSVAVPEKKAPLAQSQRIGRTGYTVTIRHAKRSIITKPGETILQAALREGVRYPHGCESGNCGSCKSRLEHGQVSLKAYADYALSDAERAAGLILACRAVPESDCDVAVHRGVARAGEQASSVPAGSAPAGLPSA